MKQKHIAITAAVAAVAVVLVGGIGLASIGLFGGESEKATPEKATPESSLSAKDEPIQDAKPQANASDESGDVVQPLPSAEGPSAASASGEEPGAAGNQPAPEWEGADAGGSAADNTVDFGSPDSDPPSDEQKPPAGQDPSDDGERWTGFY